MSVCEFRVLYTVRIRTGVNEARKDEMPYLLHAEFCHFLYDLVAHLFRIKSIIWRVGLLFTCLFCCGETLIVINYKKIHVWEHTRSANLSRDSTWQAHCNTRYHMYESNSYCNFSDIRFHIHHLLRSGWYVHSPHTHFRTFLILVHTNCIQYLSDYLGKTLHKPLQAVYCTRDSKCNLYQ